MTVYHCKGDIGWSIARNDDIGGTIIAKVFENSLAQKYGMQVGKNYILFDCPVHVHFIFYHMMFSYFFKVIEFGMQIMIVSGTMKRRRDGCKII